MNPKWTSRVLFLWFNVNVNEEQVFKTQLRSLQIGGVADVYYTLGYFSVPAVLFLIIGGIMEDFKEKVMKLLDEEKEKENLDSIWLILLLGLMFGNFGKEEPTINVYIGGEDV